MNRVAPFQFLCSYYKAILKVSYSLSVQGLKEEGFYGLECRNLCLSSEMINILSVSPYA